MVTPEPDPPSPDGGAPDPHSPSPAGEGAAASKAPRPRRPFWRRWGRRAAIAGVLGLLLGVGLYLTRERTLHPLLVRAAPRVVGDLTGLELELAALHGDWLHGLSVEGLELHGTADDQPLRRVSVPRATITWDLVGLVRGRADAIAAVEAVVDAVEVDLTRGAAPAEPSGDGAWPRLPAYVPTVDVVLERLDVRLDASQRIEASGVRLGGRFDAPPEPEPDAAPVPPAPLGPWRLSLEAERVALDDGATALGASVALEGAWDDGVLEDLRLRLDGEPLLADGTLDLADLPERSVGLDLTLLGPVAHGSLRAGLESGRLRGHLALEGLDLRRAALQVETWSDLERGSPLPAGLAGLVELDATLDLDLDDPSALVTGVDLEAVALAVEDLSFDDVQLHAELRGTEARLYGLRVDAGDNHLRSEDVRLDLAALTLVDVLDGARGSFEARGTELDRFVPRPTEGPGSTLAEPPAHRYDLRADLRDGRFELARGRLEVAGGVVDLETGSVTLEDDGDGVPRALLDLRTRVDLPDLGPLGDLLAFGPLTGSLRGEVRATGDLERPEELRADVRLEGRDVALPGIELGRVELTGQARGPRVTIRRATFEGPHAGGRVDGTVDLGRQRFEGLNFQVQVLDPEAWSALLRPGGEIGLKGRLDGPLLRPDGTLDAVATGLAVRDLPLEDLTLSARAQDGTVDVGQLTFGTPYGAVSTRLEVDLPDDARPLRLRLRELGVVAPGGERMALVNPMELDLDLDALDVQVQDLLLRGDCGEVELDGSWSARGASGAVALRDADPMPFVAAFLPAELAGRVGVERVDAELRGTWSDARLELDTRGDLAGLRVPQLDARTHLAWEARWEDGRLELVRADLDLLREGVEPAPLVRLAGSLPLDPVGDALLPPGDVRLAGHVELPADLRLTLPALGDGAGLDGGARVDLTLGGTWSAPTGELRARSEALRLDLGSALAQLAPERTSVVAELTLGPDGLRLADLELLAEGRLDARLEGGWELPLDVPRWLADDAPDPLEAPFRLSGRVVSEDLAFLGSLDRQLRRVGGRVDVELDLSGTPREPDGQATLALTGGLMKLAGAPQLDDLEVRARYAGGAVELERFETRLGAAPLSATGRVTDLGGDRLVELSVDGENVLLVRNANVRARADFEGVTIRGPLDAMALEGTVRLRNSRLTQTIDFLGALQGGGGGGVASQQHGVVIAPFADGPLSRMTFDLKVETDEPVRIVSNVARGDVLVSLRVRGTGRTLLPQGALFIEDTRVLLPGGKLDVTGGTIQFEKGNPFVPQLDLYGETRMLGYDISAHISGAYDAPIVDLTSSPPLTQDALLVLLLSGQLPSEASSKQAAETISIYFAKDLLTQWFDDGLESDGPSLLDRFEYESGREISDGGVQTFEAKLRVADALWIDQDKLYLVAEQDRYEDYNAGIRISITLR